MKESVREYEILKVIKERMSISRMELAKLFNLTPARISKLINNLLEEEIVVEKEEGRSTGGRRPMLLSINEDKFKNILGINITANDRIFLSISKINGDFIKKIKIDLLEKNKKDMLNFLDKLIRKNLEKNENIGVIVLVVTGPVDEEFSKILMSPHYEWETNNIVRYLERKYDLPIILENDVRAMAYTEKQIGSCKEVENFVMLNLCQGIGTSSFIDNKMYRGFHSMAGEIGHIVINTNSIRKCSCGKRGCLEAEASDKAILKRLESEIKVGKYSILKEILQKKGKLEIKDVLYGIKKRDFLVIKAITEAVEYIAQGLNIIISIVDPEKIVLAGELFKSEFVMENIRFYLNKISLDIQKCEIESTKLGEDLMYYSAISVVRENLFENLKFTEKYI
ncbi:MAG: ROK family protein [Fusobacterium sp. JB021]|nr:ROK family protein [Fusobacterium sp. JB020]MDP0494199.1 ROK family protein [Fusobacterium sp. JB021]MDP0505684.1 ROK family protein [Fusobacterium sp. JB019]